MSVVPNRLLPLLLDELTGTLTFEYVLTRWWACAAGPPLDEWARIGTCLYTSVTERAWPIFPLSEDTAACIPNTSPKDLYVSAVVLLLLLGAKTLEL